MRSEDLGIFLVPHFRIDVELISRDQIGGRAELTFLPALHVVRHRLEPDIDVEADLMAGVVGDHRSAARLRHVPDQKTVPADLFRVLGEPFDEANELRIAPLRLRDGRMTCQSGPVIGNATAPARQPAE